MSTASVKNPDYSASRLFLIGPPGTGKSSIGRKLSNILGYQFLDADNEIERHTGVDLGWLLDIEGEQGLWRREQQIIERVTTMNKVVLATGGGNALSPYAIEQLPRLGVVILLEVDLEMQLQRLSIEAHRPFLHRLDADGKSQALQQMMQERDATYRRLQSLTVNTGQSSVTATAQKIAAMIDGHQDLAQ